MLDRQLHGGALYLRICGRAENSILPFTLRDANSGEIVMEYADAEAAARGRQVGHVALAQLAACLAQRVR